MANVQIFTSDAQFTTCSPYLTLSPTVAMSKEIINSVQILAKGQLAVPDDENVSIYESKKLPLLLSASCCDNVMVTSVVRLFSQLSEYKGADDVILEAVEVGLILLTNCSKSAKLSRAWKILGDEYTEEPHSDNDDEDSVANVLLDTNMLKQLLEAFLTSILAVFDFQVPDNQSPPLQVQQHHKVIVDG